jgi:hypothetical protein
MADYTNSRSGPGRTAPDNAVESSWKRVEPLITPEQVRSRHLFGIPLVSAMKDPMTNKPQVYTDDMIRDTIERAVSMAESDTHLDIFPQQNVEKKPFNQQDYASFSYMRTLRRPVASVEDFSIVPPNGQSLYTIPPEWIEMSNAHTGQINLIPLGNAIAYGTPANASSGGALFLNVLGNQPWVPAFWQITYTSGFPDGMLPRIVNELVGTIAAMEVLSALAATYGKSSSHSLSLDGLSQSISTPGPAIFQQRMQELTDKRKSLTKKLKTQYGLNLFSGDV